MLIKFQTPKPNIKAKFLNLSTTTTGYLCSYWREQETCRLKNFYATSEEQFELSHCRLFNKLSRQNQTETHIAFWRRLISVNPMDRKWLRIHVAEYIEEEIGHEKWILNDIEACGGDKQQVAASGSPILRQNSWLLMPMILSTASILCAFWDGSCFGRNQRRLPPKQRSMKEMPIYWTVLILLFNFVLWLIRSSEVFWFRLDEQLQIVIKSCKRFYKLYANFFRWSLSINNQCTQHLRWSLVLMVDWAKKFVNSLMTKAWV